jgi:hypothetical protein
MARPGGRTASGGAVKYIPLIYSNPRTWDALTEEQREALAPEHAALIRELIRSGEWVDDPRMRL